MSNSKLVVYTKLSPYCTKPRNSTIKGISIHTMAGPGSVEGCGQVFQTSQASSHYGIGPDGRIGQYVLEENRAWCCSHAVDHSVVTIEVSSIQAYQEPYECTEAAYRALIDLCVDICQRNGISKLIWKEGKQYCPAFTGNWSVCNMVPHRYTTDKGKSCPGNYLFGKYGEIAAEVNRRLAGGTGSAESEDEDMTQEKFNEMFGVAMTNYLKNLQDNDAGDWSVEDREWGIANGLFNGSGTTSTGEPNYMWQMWATREQLAALFHRFKQMFWQG